MSGLESWWRRRGSRLLGVSYWGGAWGSLLGGDRAGSAAAAACMSTWRKSSRSLKRTSALPQPVVITSSGNLGTLSRSVPLAGTPPSKMVGDEASSRGEAKITRFAPGGAMISRVAREDALCLSMSIRTICYLVLVDDPGRDWAIRSVPSNARKLTGLAVVR